jgi:hypothetical protein
MATAHAENAPPTHRHVHSLPRFDFASLGTGASSLFDVEPLPGGASAAVLLDALAASGKEGPSFVACAGDSKAMLLRLKPDADLAGHMRRSDVALLHAGILEPVLGITPAMEAAETHVWYPQDAETALRELRGGKGQVLFLVNPTS